MIPRGQRTAVGRTRQAIAEGYNPEESHGAAPESLSHQAVCLLNAGAHEAQVEITLYFTDRDPVGLYTVRVPARRALHVRFNDLSDPAPVPRDTDYASPIVSDVLIVAQHTRLDSRQADNALMATLVFPCD
jgi:hypothetical protein